MVFSKTYCRRHCREEKNNMMLHVDQQEQQRHVSKRSGSKTDRKSHLMSTVTKQRRERSDLSRKVLSEKYRNRQEDD